jgi:hypothetical protein
MCCESTKTHFGLKILNRENVKMWMIRMEVHKDTSKQTDNPWRSVSVSFEIGNQCTHCKLETDQ